MQKNCTLRPRYRAEAKSFSRGEADEFEGPVRVSSGAAGRLGDVGDPGQSVKVQGQVP